MKTEEPQGLISIERVVAFVVGPLLAIGFGWAGSWLAQNVPGAPAIPAEAATYVGGAISLGVAGLVWKWLHGRQIREWTPAIQKVEHAVSELPAPLKEGVVGDLAAAGDHLREVVEAAVAKALKQPVTGEAAAKGGAQAVSSAAVAGAPPPDEVQPAQHDPAPSSAGQVADSGAASVQ